MSKKNLTNRLWLVVVFSIILATSTQEAFAWGGGSRKQVPRSRRHEEVVVRGRKYDYRDGRFYWPGFFSIFVVTPPIGAVIKVLPAGHRSIFIGGITYYHYDNVYYKTCPSGYVVVPQPQPQQSQIVTGGNLTINVPNSNGSYTPVMLVKQNNGYVGPQGEYYSGNPTVEQLKALYGK